MRLFAYLTFAFATAAIADTEHWGHAHHKRQQNPYTRNVVVTGAAGAKPLIPRLEVGQMMQDKDLWNIFLLAMYKFQHADPNDPESYFGICGIHGQPYKVYNHVNRCPKCPMTGYCHHHTVTFSLWHKPYVALMDQALRKFALLAANEFRGADRAKYVAAANRLLIPRWDWALPLRAGDPAFPAYFTDDDSAVTTPDGPINIQNPLKFFNYSAFGIPHGWTTDPAAGTTTRDPYAITPQWRRNLRANTWAALSSPQTFNEFGCEALNSDAKQNLNPHSLESCHDQPHGGIGGDMNVLQNSACDPAFILHHANVDWLMALWQAVHPTSWMVPHPSTGDSYTHTAGTMMGPDSPLYPFLKDENGHFWTSNEVRNSSVFGFYYPGIHTRQDAIATMNKYYRDGGNGQGSHPKRGLLGPFPTLPLLPLLQNVTNGFSQIINDILAPYSSVSNGKTIEEYTVVIEADTMAERGSFIVFLFDGTPDPVPANWPLQQDALLGWHNFFTSDESMTGVPSLAGVSITDALLDRVMTGQLQGMDDATVKQYLSDHMVVRVMRAATKQEILVQDMPGFALVVQHNAITMPTSADGLPTWDPAQSLKQIITPGGLLDECLELSGLKG